jgi:hypothetical protein
MNGKRKKMRELVEFLLQTHAGAQWGVMTHFRILAQ